MTGPQSGPQGTLAANVRLPSRSQSEDGVLDDVTMRHRKCCARLLRSNQSHRARAEQGVPATWTACLLHECLCPPPLDLNTSPVSVIKIPPQKQPDRGRVDFGSCFEGTVHPGWEGLLVTSQPLSQIREWHVACFLFFIQSKRIGY